MPPLLLFTSVTSPDVCDSIPLLILIVFHEVRNPLLSGFTPLRHPPFPPTVSPLFPLPCFPPVSSPLVLPSGHFVATSGRPMATQALATSPRGQQATWRGHGGDGY